jgi:stage III sporulation protein AG
MILIIVGIVAMILFLTSNDENDKKIETISKYDYLSTMEYCSSLEEKLEKVLSQIKGAGEVSVMLSVDGSPEIVYAVDSDSKISSNSNGSTTTSSSSPIIVQSGSKSEPLILTENLPIVKGVIVVSSGASDIGIKLDIINAVSTLLDLSTEKISVLKGI